MNSTALAKEKSGFLFYPLARPKSRQTNTMLTIRIIAIGKTKGDWAKAAQSHYQKLLQKYCKLEIVELPEKATSGDGSIDSLKSEEATRITKRLSGAYRICLDQRGKSFSSEALAKKLSTTMNAGHSAIDIVIGGAYGLDTNHRESSDLILSLSSLTLSHQIARVTLLEQLFRSFSILANTPYHK